MEQASTLSEIYQNHLDNVSRSFAFCIRQLKQPLRHRVSLAYLLCRILDTIEDSAYPNPAEKFAQLDAFESFVRRRPSPTDVEIWVRQVPTQIPASELNLLRESALIFSDLHDQPDSTKIILQNTALDMARGMRYFLTRSEGKKGLVLTSLSDVNRYCFFVAGIVGEMLTGLFAAVRPDYKMTDSHILESHQFGLFLQKINVLKDQLEDQQVGRYLVPSQDEVWQSLEQNANGAIHYLLNIPLDEREYRIFCAWSLFLGLASIPWIKKTWTAKILDKIPRLATQHVLNQVTAVVDDNTSLRALFDKMKPDQVSGIQPPIMDAEFPDFRTLYHGELSRAHLQALGMVAGS